jgi:PAS domain S-box-containing protein
MEDQLKILQLEDSSSDAKLIQHSLKKEKINFISKVVSTKGEFENAVTSFVPDVILADHSLPNFNSLKALEICKKLNYINPFILVTGTVSEEFAVQCIKDGADDYVLKANLARLPSAIDNAIKKKNTEKEKIGTNEKLRKSEERYRNIVETAQEGIWMVNEQNRTIFVNHRMAEMLELSVDEMMGRPIFDFMDEEGKLIASQNLDNRKLGMRDEVDFKFITHSGKEIWVLISASPVYDKNKKYEGSLAMIANITGRKLTEQKLEEKIKELNTFIYKATHDLRGPLSSIMGLTDLANKAGTNTDKSNYLKMIADSTKKLDGILISLIQVMSVKNTKPDIKEINFKTVINETLKKLAHIDKCNNVKFNIHVNNRKAFFSDEAVLNSVFQNLIENSIKYQNGSNTAPFITITISDTNSGIAVELADNGIGIESGIQDKVFDMFYRGNQDSKGSGLGLYIVKNSIEKLGGTIQLKSEPMVGTTMKIILPYNR